MILDRPVGEYLLKHDLSGTGDRIESAEIIPVDRCQDRHAERAPYGNAIVEFVE
jgi:hypothetical protein